MMTGVRNLVGYLVEPEIRPMLAFARHDIFDSPDYLYEVLWRGERSLAYLHPTHTVLHNRWGEDITWRYPELGHLHEQLLVSGAVIDGEIVVLDHGRPSLERLQIRERATDPYEITRLAAETPALFVAFDLLRLEGNCTMKLTLLERKHLLQNAIRQSRHMVIGSWVEGKGTSFFAQITRLGMEGVIAKDKHSPYLPGQRSTSWLKVPRSRIQDCVICGYTQGRGRRATLFGSLVLGAYLGQELVHVGQVGSGFTVSTMQVIIEQLESLRTSESPFRTRPEIDRPITWVKPEIVCEVEYVDWTAQSKLLSPRFIQLRPDKRPPDAEIEDISVAAPASYNSQ